MPHYAAVLTISDLGAAGQREDTAGPAAIQLLDSAGFQVVEHVVVPDDHVKIVEHLEEWAESEIALIVTAGGTGLTERDVTPGATNVVIEYEVPGIPEAMRRASAERVPTAMLSRGIAGVRNRTLIVNLPGSEKAVRENLEVILPVLQHACDQLRGDTSEVAETHEEIQKTNDSEPSGNQPSA